MKKQIQLAQSDVTLSYEISGNGFPVILLHGFGEDSRIWSGQVAHLKNFCQCIVPDLPGSGKSGRLPEGSMELYAEAVFEMTSAENLDRFILIGHSMGGYIALAFAEKYPAKLAGLGLFHSSAYADDEEKKATREKGIRFIKEFGSAKFLEPATTGLFSEATKEKRPELIKEIIDRYANFQAESLVQYYEAMMARPDRTNIIKKIGVPVIFILGKFDAAVPLARGLEQTHLPDICYIHICQKSGHMGMLEETTECNRALEKYLKESAGISTLT